LGTEFTIHDHRAVTTIKDEEHASALKESLKAGKGKAKTPQLHELAVIRYERNLMGRIPNFMTCMVPNPEAEHERGEGRRIQKTSIIQRYESKNIKPVEEKNVGDHIVSFFRRLSAGKDNRNSMDSEVDKEYTGVGGLETLEGGTNRRISGVENELNGEDDTNDTLEGYGGVEQDDQQDLLVFETKKPSWNKNLGAWTLNFNGRVKKASKKNFLISAKEGLDSFEDLEVDVDGNETVAGAKAYLRFGKNTKHRFIMDFRKPLSPVVALGICITSFAKKIAVT
jgi:hypothetical protein